MLRALRVPSTRSGAVIAAVTAALLALGTGFAWGTAHGGDTLRACANRSGVLREASGPCADNEREHVLVTESGLAALRATLEAAAAAVEARVDALEANDTDVDARLDALDATDAALAAADADADGRLDALEAADADADGRLDALEAADDATDARLDALEARVARLELAVVPPDVVFTKIYDGGHYASYEVTGTGFQPGSTVTSGVGLTETVADDGTFSIFGGNLFCDRDVSVSGTAANGAAITRSTPVVCDSETPLDVVFTKIYDGGHYASYEITGTGFRPGSTVTSGVGLTETVAYDGSFSVFGGNLFCDREVSLTGTARDGSPVSRSAPVECDSE